MNYQGFRTAILDRHDIYCNQKYETRVGYVELPYSFHLISTERIAERFAKDTFGEAYLNTIIVDDVYNSNNDNLYEPPNGLELIKCVAIAHDVLEDGRMTYKDLHRLLAEFYPEYPTFCKLVAESCYRLTDEKGKNRDQRKNAKFYEELSENIIAKYVKICDRIANVSYGSMMGGTMLEKYRLEQPTFYTKIGDSDIFQRVYFELNSLLSI